MILLTWSGVFPMAVSASFKQQCPSCKAMISIKESMIGKKVECTKCKDKFIAERPDDDEPEEQAPSRKDLKRKRPRLEVEDDQTHGKAGKNKPETNGKSHGKSPQKSRTVDDEEEDEA